MPPSTEVPAMTRKCRADRSSITRLLFAAAVLLLADPALAFRCKGKLVMEGDPQAKVRKFCGEPVSVQQRMIYRGGVPRQTFEERVSLGAGATEVGSSREELLIHDRSVVEVLVEEWTYNFGPHRLMRVVRFENGLVAEVTRLGYGYLE
jgi:hypothetical protein